MPKKNSSLEEMMIVDTLSRMDGKLDKLDDRMDGMAVTLTKQQASLDEHIRRTNLLESKIDKETEVLKTSIPHEVRKELEEINGKKWESRKKTALLVAKVLGALSALGGGGFGLHKALTFISKLLGS